uniref:Transmembrane protein n=1 Tax=Helicotheca tamesis TaxID=374047 RepID=A0A7S2HFY2_9STRA|mmetsp:Transcript_17758/g.24463  ORF Transcript_17758/g.24463 Transcript_17758/m.24463 type:complete len:182 (+) Transcript_17758:158-703(+)
MTASKLLCALLALVVPSANAFTNAATRHAFVASPQTPSTTAHNMIPPEHILSTASTYLSTIDADIDSIPTDQFGTVFAGGIVVMFGGVVSALIVGFLLENGNLYANVVADSMAEQEAAGEESFWDSLSPQDRSKAEEMVKKLRESKQNGEGGSGTAAATEIKSEKSEEKKEELAMFSDYDD